MFKTNVGGADRILGWEIFRVHYLNKGAAPDEAFSRAGSRELVIALETHHGKWVRSSGVDQSFRLVADSPELTPDCKFTLRIL